MIITNDTSPIFKIRQYLPSSVSHSLSRLDKTVLDRICEIRLYANSGTFITIDGTNCVLTNTGISKSSQNPICVSQEEIEDFIYKFCKGSVYSHEDTLSEFYLSNDSVRVGIAGEAIYKNGILQGVGKISSINIRIPRHIDGCSKELAEHIECKGFPDGKGILVISSPGAGKTTILRDLARHISCSYSDYPKHTPRRVCVIDERREIYISVDLQCALLQNSVYIVDRASAVGVKAVHILFEDQLAVLVEIIVVLLQQTV